ncbi:DUF3618 domain-containing protein [Corynebacterium otitidis]|uniref:DUF3618 domain-containing protein n=1 Tax=Corynebacterium otitidis ATCC 51513 TaxID=883169 RepID=K0YGR8_9CORY|nr:DUF3618 domain-containing protein [Corynebacterium otitidis]EJZ82561.1 hypothetical protein HMPREF9719_00549 [Corynebacterium otitidis ATCC 51513]KKO82913.1 membrane protein [Corynebacterium otitidis]
MARNIEDIQRDIERTRNQLASTLDRLSERTKPQSLANEGKERVLEWLRDPQTQKILLGVGAAVAGLVTISVVRSRKKRKDLKDLQKALAKRY